MPDKNKTLDFLYLASSAIKDSIVEAYAWGGCPQDYENEMVCILGKIDELKWKIEHARD